MKQNCRSTSLLLCVMVAVVACSSNASKSSSSDEAQGQTKSVVNVPQFNADSAFQYVKAQVDFGPRVPNSKEHVACGQYLAQKLQQFGAQVTNQYADLAAYNGSLLKARNIIGSYKPETKKRIALFAHWDTRPWADADPDPKNQRKPVLGANDGASGVGVLLEIARQLQQQQPELGIDLIFLDAEDYGAHASENLSKEDAWALGAQYWARNPHVQGYNARFGILLDMVGGRDAVFKYEAYSEQYASSINRKVWKAANNLGFGRHFVKENIGGVTDDHLFINRYAKIPTIDIISYSDEYSFYQHWHTLKDDMDGIDRATLQAVGQTVLQVIYNEK